MKAQIPPPVCRASGEALNGLILELFKVNSLLLTAGLGIGSSRTSG